METSFGHWNMSLLLQDENPIIGRICAGNSNIRFFRCPPNRDVISSLNPPNSRDPNGGTYIRIGGLLKEKKTIFWSITKLGRSVCRVIWEGSLALFRISYKELSMESIWVQGSSFISKERQVSLRISWLHIGYHLFAPYLLLFLTDFSQVWYRCKAIFRENPMPYVMKGRDYSLWKTSAITEIAPPRSPWSYLMYIQYRLILSEHFPLHLGCSPLIFHCWKPFLMWISGINMGFTSSISRVWRIGIVEWLSRLKLDLEAVDEDASDEVLQFEIQISVTFCRNPSQRRIISQNPLILDSYLGLSSEIL